MMKHNKGNEGNDGSIWGSKVQVVVAAVVITLMALANYAPALAAGVSGLGK